MENIETLDMSGDVGLKVRGQNIEDLFANAAAGMLNLITDIRNIPLSEKRNISLANDSLEDLFIIWLNELIFLFERDGFIGRSFTLDLQGNILTAQVSGGIFYPEVNEKRLLIKAATYHMLSLRKINDHWEAVVVFDI